MHINILARIARKLLDVKPDIEKIHRNREEVYKISRKLPVQEGYQLMNLYDESIRQSFESYKKFYLNN